MILCFAALGINWTPGKHEVNPVTRSEIDISVGSITQNPGY